MNKSDIISLPDKNLRKRSRRVGVITAETEKIIKGMQDATLSWEDSRKHELGVALAAVQINKHLRIIIIRNNFEDKNDRSFQVYINPEVTKAYGELIEDFEGCLSIKDIYGKVPRYDKVKVKALDLQGKQVRISAEGFLARVLQHEIDHTKGIVFIDHIKDRPEAFYALRNDGSLDPLDYEKDIKNNVKLWG
ncbi:MAG TPA: peptide deformylase [Candidatus Saccharimonadales bacterium]|nr:peptide deformylase [Candidatus Saccharimonadales bacterium]